MGAGHDLQLTDQIRETLCMTAAAAARLHHGLGRVRQRCLCKCRFHGAPPLAFDVGRVGRNRGCDQFGLDLVALDTTPLTSGA